MKIRLFILVFCVVFLNASLFSFSQMNDTEMILMQKYKAKEPKKKSEEPKKEDDDDRKKDSMKEKIKDTFKRDKDKKSGGRFGDKRF